MGVFKPAVKEKERVRSLLKSNSGRLFMAPIDGESVSNIKPYESTQSETPALLGGWGWGRRMGGAPAASSAAWMGPRTKAMKTLTLHGRELLMHLRHGE